MQYPTHPVPSYPSIQPHLHAAPRLPPKSFRCVLFPADSTRRPSVVEVLTSPVLYSAHPTARMPHPEVHMDSPNSTGGARAWDYCTINALDGIERPLSQPYIVFFPTMSQDGSPFPINQTIRDIQGPNFKDQCAWRGNVVIGKYTAANDPFNSLIDAGTQDFAIIRNLIRSRASPRTFY
ncbi:hypothetical protein MKEN_00055800 [Mycena kentingensis (nom. inval.)]|nr:hypothetical protein MKEN_00055800 [Mycena kentingensis (nom. inval.)]